MIFRRRFRPHRKTNLQIFIAHRPNSLLPKQLKRLNQVVWKIRKVKAYSPSPFYDGKYHPPIISSPKATGTKLYNRKLGKFKHTPFPDPIFFSTLLPA